LSIDDVQSVIGAALGAETVTSTVEGRERYGVTSALSTRFRSDPQSIARDVQVAVPGGGTVPLGEVAKVEADARCDDDPDRERPARRLCLRRHRRPRPRRLCRGRAKEAVANERQAAARLFVSWSGQYEYLERAEGASGDRRAADAR
jgi:Cu(I)/Ag(I) efflux system membrane protein CusA/SilA